MLEKTKQKRIKNEINKKTKEIKKRLQIENMKRLKKSDTTNIEKIDLPLFEEFGQSSQDSFVLDPRSPRSRDVCPNSAKSGKSILPFWVRLTYLFGENL